MSATTLQRSRRIIFPEEEAAARERAKKLAARDAIRQDLARKRLINFTTWTMPDYRVNWHHNLVASELDKFIDGETTRLMLFMPPRHGKTELSSRRLPALAFGKNPDLNIIACSYSADLAERVSRDVQRIMDTEKYCALFPETQLGEYGGRTIRRNDIFEIAGKRGVYRAAGVRGGIGGMGADIAIIDDPIKDRLQAESEVYREAVWEWFTSTLFMRLERRGRLLITLCMTGDTPVLLPNGTERALRDVRAGDRVATLGSAGRLSSSVVVKHARQGYDNVYRITMTSGRTVRANARHPFLVSDGETQRWVRLSDLTTGQKIVAVRGSGGSGRAACAQLTDVVSPSSAVVSAPLTTTRRSGQTDIGHHLFRTPNDAACALRGVTDSRRPSTMLDFPIRVDVAPSVDNIRRVSTRQCRLIGKSDYASTMITAQASCVGSSATTAILPSDGSNVGAIGLTHLQPTSDFTTDEIASIESAGVEEVFDVQIAHTENFIANGLVSHNTRWHHDDIAGRLLRMSDEGLLGSTPWKVICLRGIREDEPLDYDPRQPGEALWSWKKSAKSIYDIKSLNSYDYEALFQQRPTAAEGALFKREWFKTYTCTSEVLNGERVVCYNVPQPDGTAKKWLRSKLTRFVTIDLAMSLKTSADYTVLAHWGLTPDARLLLLELERVRLEGPDHEAMVKRHWLSQKPSLIGIESVQYQSTLAKSLARQGLPCIELKPDRDKYARAIPAAAMAEALGVWVPEAAPWLAAFVQEHLEFPRGTHDDMVDCLSYAAWIVSNRLSSAASLPIGVGKTSYWR